MSFEHGTLPGNLHFKEANPNNKSLKEGVIKVSGCPHVMLASSDDSN